MPTGPDDPCFTRDPALGPAMPRLAVHRTCGTPAAVETAQAFARSTVQRWRTPVADEAVTDAVDILLHNVGQEEAWLGLVESATDLLLLLTLNPPIAPADTARPAPVLPRADDATRWIRIRLHAAPSSAPTPHHPKERGHG
ncbi:hypothetical protein [Kitasatospora sp. NPDC058046]|uniref:hypothetical protein n=1 Tax=Kitasatospora sp. NPDC058046 TaxID=3346312 RepID=UPI0036DA374C